MTSPGGTDDTAQNVPTTGEHPVVHPHDLALWARHDVIVVALALLLIIAGARIYRAMTAPELQTFELAGLRFERPSNWLPPRTIQTRPSVLGSLGKITLPNAPPPETADATGVPYHKIFQSTQDPLIRLEVRVDHRPEFRGMPMWLRLERQTRYGEFYWTGDSDIASVSGRDWQRTRFQYAFKATEDDAPQVATGIEYATVNGDLVYVVTAHGSERQARRLEASVLDTLRVGVAPR